VAGRWSYLYRAVDSTGATIDFWFSAAPMRLPEALFSSAL
jgi:transposase-like protein